jgi:hypothetical protein
MILWPKAVPYRRRPKHAIGVVFMFRELMFTLYSFSNNSLQSIRVEYLITNKTGTKNIIIFTSYRNEQHHNTMTEFDMLKNLFHINLYQPLICCQATTKMWSSNIKHVCLFCTDSLNLKKSCWLGRMLCVTPEFNLFTKSFSNCEI